MAMIAMVGWESGSMLEMDSQPSGVVVSTTQKRSGAYALYQAWGIDPADVLKYITASAEIYLQVGLYLTGTQGYGDIFKWRKGSTVLGTVQANGGDVLKVYTGDSADLRVTGTKVLSVNTWYVLELRIKINDAGILTLRVDGIIDGTTFSGDTKPGADADIDTISLCRTGKSGQCGYYMDDFIVNDTVGTKNISWPTAAKIILLKPDGAGSSTQWTPSAGANYQCVDEVPPTDTDKITTNVDAKLDLYALEDLPAEASGIAAVQVNAWALKAGVPAVNSLKLACRTHASNYLSDGVELGTTMALAKKIWELNPNTNAAWTIEEVNAMEAGVQAAA